jgi:hypothetical protein
MITLDVEGWQARQIEAHSACVVLGQMVCTGAHDCVAPTHIHGCYRSTPADEGRHGNGYVIPHPWLDATKPCETCGELGWVVEGQTIGWPAGEQVQCPDCRDGHPIIDVRAKCPKCRGEGGGIVVNQWGEPEDDDCGNCSGTGWVSLGRYTIELLPVVHWSDDDEEQEGCVSVGHRNGLAYICIQRFGGHAVTLDPLPVPGRDMVAVGTKVES